MTYQELRTFVNKWIRNSAISPFSQMRMNTVINDIIDKVEAGGEGGGSSDASDLTSGTLDNARLNAVPQSKIAGLTAALSAKADSSSLAPVATSGSYGDLDDLPETEEFDTSDILRIETVNQLGDYNSANTAKRFIEALTGDQSGLYYFNSTIFYKITMTNAGEPLISVAQNLFTYSEQIGQNFAGLNGASLTNDQTTAPDSTTTAEKLTAASGSYTGGVRRFFTFEAKQYTLSLYLKKGNYDYVAVRLAGAFSGDNRPFINLASGAVNTLSISGLTMSQEDAGNGWRRVFVRYTPVAEETVVDIIMVNSSGFEGVALAGTENFYIWGVQLSEGGKRVYTKTTSGIVP